MYVAVETKSYLDNIIEKISDIVVAFYNYGKDNISEEHISCYNLEIFSMYILLLFSAVGSVDEVVNILENKGIKIFENLKKEFFKNNDYISKLKECLKEPSIYLRTKKVFDLNFDFFKVEKFYHDMFFINIFMYDIIFHIFKNAGVFEEYITSNEDEGNFLRDLYESDININIFIESVIVKIKKEINILKEKRCWNNNIREYYIRKVFVDLFPKKGYSETLFNLIIKYDDYSEIFDTLFNNKRMKLLNESRGIVNFFKNIKILMFTEELNENPEKFLTLLRKIIAKSIIKEIREESSSSRVSFIKTLLVTLFFPTTLELIKYYSDKNRKDFNKSIKEFINELLSEPELKEVSYLFENSFANSPEEMFIDLINKIMLEKNNELIKKYYKQILENRVNRFVVKIPSENDLKILGRSISNIINNYLVSRMNNIFLPPNKSLIECLIYYCFFKKYLTSIIMDGYDSGIFNCYMLFLSNYTTSIRKREIQAVILACLKCMT